MENAEESSEHWEKLEVQPEASHTEATLVEDNTQEPKKTKLPKQKSHISRGFLFFNIVLALIAGAMIGFFAFWYTLGPKNEAQKATTPSPTATITPSPTSQAQATPEPARSENIIVDEPRRGVSVKTPIRITGQARVFESALSVRLKDPSGKTVAEDKVVTDQGEPGQMNAFTAFLPYPRQAVGTQGTLEVFTKAASDGREEDLIQIPIIFER